MLMKNLRYSEKISPGEREKDKIASKYDRAPLFWISSKKNAFDWITLFSRFVFLSQTAISGFFTGSSIRIC